jgi:hypothetical protein
VQALVLNTTGNNNTANGVQALFSNTTGNVNTANGYSANVSVGNLTNATAIGNGNQLAGEHGKLKEPWVFRP